MQNVVFGYSCDGPVLDIDGFDLVQGQQLLLHGVRGSGKSTLLGLIAGVLTASSGHVEVAGQDLSTMSGTARDRFRADNCGVIFQQFNLVPFLNVRDNIAMGLTFVSRTRRPRSPGELDRQIAELLSELGLEPTVFLNRPAGRLSVSQQQRVAAARALIAKPRLVLADEPNPALDPDSANAFLNLMTRACRQNGTSAIIVSQDLTLETLFDEVRVLNDINQASVAGEGA